MFPKTGSPYCFLHHRLCARAVAQIPEDTLRRQVIEDANARQPDVAFHQPLSAKHLDQIRTLHRLFRDYTIWTIDVEFGTLTSTSPIPYAVTVRDAKTDEVIVSSAVDYASMPLDDMEAQIQEHHLTVSTNELPFWATKAYFAEVNQGNDTSCGLILQAIGDQLRAQRFTPETYRILYWFSSTGIVVFVQALYGYNDLVTLIHTHQLTTIMDSESDENILQPVNVGNLLRTCTDLENVKCGYVHRSLFPGEETVMHYPDNDTLAMNQILHRLLKESIGWL